MYQKTLMDQWDNLCADFAGEFDFLCKQGNAAASFNRWYEARVHRWSSDVYAEGMILAQLQKRDFAQQLTGAMKRFRFREVPSINEKSVWSGIPVGLLVGAVCGGMMSFLHWSVIRSIISGIVALVVVSGALYKKNEAFNQKALNDVKKAYIRQLTDYRSELLAICRQHHID